jgi:hypothetical protein
LVKLINGAIRRDTPMNDAYSQLTVLMAPKTTGTNSPKGFCVRGRRKVPVPIVWEQAMRPDALSALTPLLTESVHLHSLPFYFLAPCRFMRFRLEGANFRRRNV